MAVNKPNPRMMKDLRLRVGSDEYQGHVSNFALVPTMPTAEWRGGTPEDVYTDVSPASWLANMTVIQDYETDSSLALFLLKHQGDRATMEFEPVAGGDFTALTVLTIVAPQIGGAVNAFNEATVAMPALKPIYAGAGFARTLTEAAADNRARLGVDQDPADGVEDD